jgi:predicted regulator of Ras-like GTPase activity (Roadblock/LC7/MglB family)
MHDLGTENPRTDQQTYLDLLLREMNGAGHFRASVLVSSDGLPLSSVASPFDMEIMAATVTLVGHTIEQAREKIGLDEVDEVSVVQADKMRLICRHFSMGGEQVILAAIAPPHQTYRRLTNRAIKAIQKAWEGL